MSYEPKLRHSAREKITAYLEQRYTTRDAYLRAVDEIRVALLNLAANPRQALAPPGLFELRPIFRFSLHADGVRRDVQVCFCYDQDDPGERTILITDFMPVPF
jgi:hypothetical protein